MTLSFKKKKTKKEQMAEVRRLRRGEKSFFDVILSHCLDVNRLIIATIFLVLSFLIILICFVGQSPAGPPVFVNQTARLSIVADFPFTYESQLLTKRLKEQKRIQVAPVYRLEKAPKVKLCQQIAALQKELNQFAPKYALLTPSEQTLAVNDFVEKFRAKYNSYINSEDIQIILKKTNDASRKQLFTDGLLIAKEILRNGIYHRNQFGFQTKEGRPYLVNVEINDDSNEVHIQSQEEAIRLLRINLSISERDPILTDPDLALAIYRVLKTKLTPNIVYDKEKSEEKVAEAIRNVDPVIVKVVKGQSITEAGLPITPEQIEQLNVYRKELKERKKIGFGFNLLLVQRIFLTFALLSAALIYLTITLRKIHRNKIRQVALCSLSLLLNLTLIRLIFQLGESRLLSTSNQLLGIVPFMAPCALAPMLVAIMMEARSGILVSMLVSIFTAFMLGNSLEIFLFSFLSSLVGIYCCRDIRLRTRVVRAGVLSGFTMAIFAAFMAFSNNPQQVLEQMAAALATGTLTGMIAIGLLPIFENLFKLTTDITLLELTDFNHPILRQLQLLAPGTYHHSFMVANIAERAAAEIGANSLLCRACALFHDIGKMSKPEYFIENQKNNTNLHGGKNPSMSALIIKSHVKEGIEIARQSKLPQLIIDVIEQHHGNTLIQYFYNKALQQKLSTELLEDETTSKNGDLIDESIYRYDGPRPQFIESAIVFFADSVEAASRSLKKATPQSIKELIEHIFTERLKGHQLDECPITLEDINKIKKSFNFSLLNMLHSRIEYTSQK